MIGKQRVLVVDGPVSRAWTVAMLAGSLQAATFGGRQVIVLSAQTDQNQSSLDVDVIISGTPRDLFEEDLRFLRSRQGAPSLPVGVPLSREIAKLIRELKAWRAARRLACADGIRNARPCCSLQPLRGFSYSLARCARRHLNRRGDRPLRRAFRRSRRKRRRKLILPAHQL